MLAVETAQEIVLARVPPLAAEDVALDDCLGRVLAEEVRADLDLPPFDRSAMDGYALRAEDTTGTPALLDVIAVVRAGQAPGVRLGPGQAAQIMTGAPVPAGASAVQQVEKTRAVGDARVEILSPVVPGQNVAPLGSEVARGAIVLEPGASLDPSAIAVLAAVGKGRVRVGRRPRVALLVTGDELVEVGETPGPGCIRNSNGHALLAQARCAGAEPSVLGIVPDDAELLAAAVADGLAADVLVVSGGVSAGVFDLVEGALARNGVEIHFDKVAIKPGAPLVFGSRGSTLVFGLPGNPVSAQVTFDLFVRPALLRLQGSRVVLRPRVEVELASPVKNRSQRRAHLPARVRTVAGRLLAEPLRSQGSADIFAHAAANALVVLEAERTSAAAGERAPALLLGNFLEREAGDA